MKGSLPLRSEELRHIRARRLNQGDAVCVGDGGELRFRGVLSGDMVQIQDEKPLQKTERIRRIYSALPSGNRLDWMLQKSAELGITHITPVIFRRSDRKDFSTARAERILEEACSQSERFFLPVVSGVLSFKSAVENACSHGDSAVVFLHPHSGVSLLDEAGKNDISIFVGPEGGFDADEIRDFEESGISSRQIGENILRLETAVLAALSVLSL